MRSPRCGPGGNAKFFPGKPLLKRGISGTRTLDESIRVLLIDDQAIVGESVRGLLANEPDISFRYCADPNQAIQQAKETRPRSFLQDLVMPQIDGLELVRRFRVNTEVGPHSDHRAVEQGRFCCQEPSLCGRGQRLVKLPDKIELVARIRHHSSAYLNQIQRDEASRALHESQQQLIESDKSLVALNQKLEEANRTISELARTDSLTGLTNRRVFEEELNREAQRATRKERRIWRTLKLGTRSQRNREGDQKSKSGAGRTRASLDRKQLTAI